MVVHVDVAVALLGKALHEQQAGEVQGGVQESQLAQPYLLLGQAQLNVDNYLMAIYLFEEGYFQSDFGRGAAISLLMLLIVAVLSVFYVRRMVREDAAA